MKSWKKRLNDEFNEYAPALSEKVKTAPIMGTEKNDKTADNNSVRIGKRVFIGSFGAAMAAAVICALLGILGVFAPKSGFENYIFTLEINPAVVFITDTNGKVESVKSLNEDADLILADETELNRLKNVPLSEAIVVYTDTAAKLGFLDFSARDDAVRLSATDVTDNNIVSEATNSLSSYFCEKGLYVAVVEDKLSVQELCARMNLPDATDVSSLTNALNDLSVFYRARMDENASIEDVVKLYDSYIVGDGLSKIIRKEILDNVSDIVENARMLSGIASINMQIMAEAHADYWHVKNQSGSQELTELVNSMDALLAEYENKFNNSIDGFDELLSAVDIYSSYSGQNLEEVLKSLSAEQFTLETTNFVGMLENIGLDVSKFNTLLTKPQSVSKYLEQLELMISLLRDSRAEQYLKIYNESRGSISANDYEDFVQRIKQEYGSLENFWNESTKK